MKKNQVKRNPIRRYPLKRQNGEKQSQSQSQNVVVNVNQPPRRQPPRRRQPSQQQVAQRGPQIIPIPYPIMQQPTFNNNQGFNQPKVAIPTTNQTFENNFKNLSDKVNDLSQRFSTYGESFMNVLKSANDKIPAEATQVKMEEYTPPVQLPKQDTPASPIVYPEGSIKINSNDVSPSIRVPNQTPTIQGIRDLLSNTTGNNKTVTIMKPNDDGTASVRKVTYPEPRSLFASPQLRIENVFTRPKVVTDNNTIFNNPNPNQLLIENAPPTTADTKFEEQQKVNEENIIKDEVVESSTNEEAKKTSNKLVTCPLCGEQHGNNHISAHLKSKHLDNSLQTGQKGTKTVKYRGLTSVYDTHPPEIINDAIDSIRTYKKQPKAYDI